MQPRGTQKGSRTDVGAYVRHQKAISKDPAFKPEVRKKPMPRWYKYRLIEVKIYALCQNDKTTGDSHLVP